MLRIIWNFFFPLIIILLLIFHLSHTHWTENRDSAKSERISQNSINNSNELKFAGGSKQFYFWERRTRPRICSRFSDFIQMMNWQHLMSLLVNCGVSESSQWLNVSTSQKKAPRIHDIEHFFSVCLNTIYSRYCGWWAEKYSLINFLTHLKWLKKVKITFYLFIIHDSLAGWMSEWLLSNICCLSCLASFSLFSDRRQ